MLSLFISSLFLVHCYCLLVHENVTTIIGLFSICEQHQNKTELNRRALLNYVIAREIIQKPCATNCKEDTWTPLIYEGIDVCDDHPFLTRIVTNILLDKDYYYHDIEIHANSTKDNNPKSNIDNKVILIMTYLDQRLHNLLFNLFELERRKPVIYCLNPDTTIPSFMSSRYYLDIPYTIEADIYSFELHLKHFHWQKVGFLFLNSSKPETEIYKPLFHALLNTIQKSPDICYFQDTIDMDNATDFDRAIDNLNSEFQTNIVFLFGSPLDQLQLMKQASQHYHTRHIWFAQDVYEPFESFIPYQNWKMVSFENMQRHQLAKLKKYYNKYKPKFEEYFVENGTTAEYAFTKIEAINGRLRHWFKIYTYASALQKMQEVVIRVFFIENFHVFSTRTISNTFHGLYFQGGPDQAFYVVQEKLVSSTCEEYVCKAGWEKTKDKLLSAQRKWQIEYGWTCRQCADGYFKRAHGNNETCQPCPHLFVSNDKHTQCFDPYSTKPHVGSSMLFIINSFQSLFGVFVFFLKSIVFLHNRDTPVGKSADISLTFLHLFSFIILVVFLFLFHYWNPPERGCLLYAAVVGALYSLSISIVFMRTHKLLRAFNAKQRATSKDRMVTLFQQTFTIILLVVTSVILSVICLVQHIPTVVESRDSTTLTKSFHCENTWHVNIQICYAMLLQCACLVTAYRGRNLPNIFKESMTLVYVSMVTTIAFGVMFPIQYFQQDPFVYDHIPWTMFLVNSNMYVLFCYSKKMFIMVFQRRKNTAVYIRNKTFESMQQKSTSL